MDDSDGERIKLLSVNGRTAGSLRLNCLSYWTFWWIVRTIWTGYNRQLDTDDVFDSIPEFTAKENAKHLQSKRSTESETSGIETMFRVLQAFPTETAYLVVVFLVTECARLSHPFALSWFLGCITQNTSSDSMRYTYAGLLVLSAIVYTLFNMHSYYMAELFGMRMRAAYTSLIYSKIFQLSFLQHQKITSGNIINLLSTDLECINPAIVHIFTFIAGIFNTVAVVVLLYLQLGWCSLVGLATGFIFLTISLGTSRRYGQLRSKIADASDHRVQLMNEIISAIRVIKMYCWETSFQEFISKARKKEIYYIVKSNIFKAVSDGCTNASLDAVTAAMLITYYLTWHRLEVTVVFTTMLYCQMLQIGALGGVPRALQSIGQALRSFKRIEDFLREKCLRRNQRVDGTGQTNEHPETMNQAVQVTQVTASWDESNKKSTKQPWQLTDVTFTCGQGSLTAVVGPVGAGKTSLLMHLAGEMPSETGQLIRKGQISYCPQHAWIFQDTLQQNILFGENMECTRYKKVVNICGLRKDIDEMPNGDLTLIGEHGLTLSGGQKARISLARAVYRDADIYLFDDPLSAVDSKVGRHIFERCIKSFLSEKTRILVTHQTQFLPDVDQLIVMCQGTVSYIGPPNGLSDDLQTGSLTVEDMQGKAEPRTTQGSLLEDENVQGDVSWDVYLRFIRAGGTLLFIASLLLCAANAGVRASAAWFLSDWSRQVQASTNQTFENDTNDQRLMYIYTGLTAAGTLLASVTLVPLGAVLAAATQTLHNWMFSRVMRAPTRFFDISPLGIVMNRFCRDLGFADLMLPAFFQGVVLYGLMVLSQLVVICLILPWLLIAAVTMSVILYALYRFCLRAFRDLKRLEASARSPIYSHVSETLIGLQSIRILRRETDFLMKLNDLQDKHTMCWFMFMTCYRWLAFVLSSAVVIFLTLVVVLVLALKDEVSPSLLGLCLTFVLGVLEYFELVYRYMALLENYMTSVERILQYTELQQEPAPTSDHKPPVTWPEAGGIQFRDVCLHYYEGSSPALKNLTFDIKPNEKVGIVGRTGSGKSSLLHALMRLTEPSGCIRIDDINVMKIGIQDLRERISIIPQDPVLFHGTIRQNLDPQGTLEDNDLWHVLNKAQLFEKVTSMDGGLDAEVFQGGSNLSVGQRQLVCLARALIKRNKIIVLDEATANIDRATDQVIQVAVRVFFRHCTILIIAHRLETIMDCNRVMVLEQGRLVEYDNPYLLLQNRQCLFSRYAQQLGEEGFQSSFEIAQEAFINRLNT